MNRQLFGTDGIRGKVNKYPMTAQTVLTLGQSVAKYFNKEGKRIKAVIGKDTRLSGYLFENALTAGLCSFGVDVFLIGTMPTPAIAHITKSFAADLGIVISASHNSSDDNGIKIFDGNGYKLPDEVELEIEKILFKGVSSEGFNSKCLGKVFRVEDARGRYIEFVKNSIRNNRLTGTKVVLDCAHGAAYKVAPLILRELGADVVVCNNSPDGLNINSECGSQYPYVIAEAVVRENADLGIALDGDADRVILVDETGASVDGDHIMAIAAIFLKDTGLLSNDTVVATIMSNLGFEKSLKEKNINVVRTDVGDRYVIEVMKKNGHKLGGEQSGHIVFSEFSTTGDGTLTALQVMNIMKHTGKKLSKLKECMRTYPQVLKNVKVKEKRPIDDLKNVLETIKRVEEELGDDGRTLVRYSGTEQKCRVMIEGIDEIQIKKYADMICDAIEKEIGT
ncbi:MAG: phosphoglucosamine mutase [Candidatus Brocadiaceae bacterium]|nr:phosphoglucosamine mutase [Candidatus Brocadiaceae bacterium]